jgi:hypothetical protein
MLPTGITTPGFAKDWRRIRASILFDFDNLDIDHIIDRAEYYDRLVRRAIPHTILIHYNLLNSLFLGELLDALAVRGWRFVDAEYAYRDAVFASEPQIAPAEKSGMGAGEGNRPVRRGVALSGRRPCV